MTALNATTIGRRIIAMWAIGLSFESLRASAELHHPTLQNDSVWPDG